MHFLHTGWVVTHTHTHACIWGETAECVLCIIPSWNPPPGTARSSGQPAMRRPGTKSKCQSCLGRGQDCLSICSFCMFLLLWGSMGGTRVNTGRTCKLHTGRPGNKPRHVAPCRTLTHNLLAVSHRAPRRWRSFTSSWEWRWWLTPCTLRILILLTSQSLFILLVYNPIGVHIGISFFIYLDY